MTNLYGVFLRDNDDKKYVSYRRHILQRLFVAVVVIVLGIITVCLVVPRVAVGDTVQSGDDTVDITSPNLTLTDNITDTQNLLGSSLPIIQDKIQQVEHNTSTHIKLLYISSFGPDITPETWAQALLRDMKAHKNTVLLVVASDDGKLVVAVSQGSDEWLAKQQTVDDLSKTARQPLLSQDTPQWDKSALNMLTRLENLQKTSSTSSANTIGVVIFLAVFVAVVLFLVWCLISMRNINRRKKH